MGRLSGKNILLIVGQKNYNEREFDYLNDHFIEEGALVTTAAPQPEKALGRLEGYVVPDITISEARANDYHALIIIGGYGAYVYLWDNPDLHQLMREANDAGKLIVACSTAPVVLANAGILAGKKATTFPDYNASVILLQKDAIHIYENVAKDDNIITTNHPRQVAALFELLLNEMEGENG